MNKVELTRAEQLYPTLRNMVLVLGMEVILCCIFLVVCCFGLFIVGRLCSDENSEAILSCCLVADIFIIVSTIIAVFTVLFM